MDTSRAPVTMTKIPRFYINTALSGPAGSFAEGKCCWWISDIPAVGFRPHPAFKRLPGNAILEQTYIGTYMGHQESVASSGNCLGSRSGYSTLHSQNYDTYKQYCTNRNNSNYGQAGWRYYDIYDDSAVKFLQLIMRANPDTNAISSTSDQIVSGRTTNRIVFQGSLSSPTVWLDDMWRYFFQVEYNLRLRSLQVELTSPVDNSSVLNISSGNKTLPSSNGWIREFMNGAFVIGEDTHNLLELFLPSII